MIQEAACDSVKSYLWQVNYCAFSLQPMRGRHWRTSTNHREENSEESFSTQNFEEANKKLTIVKGSEKLLKDFEYHQRIHKSTDQNVYT
jgi:hypothetical protein